MAPIRILELRSVRGTGGGPEKTILQGASRISNHFTTTVCYIRDRRDDLFTIDLRAADLGVDYVEIHERHSFDRTIWRALRRLVRERQVQIVHAHDYKTDVLGLLIARAEGTIPLSTAHGWVGQSRRERIYYAVDKRLLARYPRVIAVSAQIRSELIRTGTKPERITVVLNGIDHEVYRRQASRRETARRLFGIAPGEIALGAVGRLERQKRFDLLIESLAALRRSRPMLRLLIAGEGSLRGELEEAIRSHGVGSVCRLLGHTVDVVGFHHAIDLFVQSSEYEGTPNAVLEAMALETPIVATDAGGTCELIQDGVEGLIVPPDEVQTLTAAIVHALDDPAATRERVHAARNRVEAQLSFKQRMKKLEHIYDELIREH